MITARVERVSVLDHLLQPQSDDGSLGVVSHLETITEASSAGNNVLESATNLYYVCILHNCYPAN